MVFDKLTNLLEIMVIANLKRAFSEFSSTGLYGCDASMIFLAEKLSDFCTPSSFRFKGWGALIRIRVLSDREFGRHQTTVMPSRCPLTKPGVE